MKIEVDITGALKKTAMLKAVPKAHRFIVSQWAADTVMMLKRRAGSMQKSGKGKKTGHLARNVAHTISTSLDFWKTTIGTGVGGTKEVKYASIQDQGGTTHPRVTPKSRKWAWFMYYKTKEDKYIGMALTKKARLDVRIPPSFWFTGIVKPREGDLRDAMRPENALRVAERIAGAGGEA